MERLQKVIASSGVCSRRKAEELITSGKVKVNGVLVTELGTKVTGKEKITVDDVEIFKEEPKYYVLNKPRYIISTVSDEKGRKTVIDILPAQLKKYRLFPVGRLDYDTKGVILLTNNGEFMNCLVGPESKLEKEYSVRINGIITKDDLIRLSLGVNINGYTTKRCKVFLKATDKKNNSSLVNIIITEGKYHQVKRMFETVGYEVKHLTRIRFGEITTDGLSEGDVRELTPHEVKRLVVQSKGE